MIELMHGDCLELMKDVPDQSVDMILCDLPYGTTACAWDAVIPFEPLWEQYRRVAKRNAAIVLTASQPFTTALISSNMREFRYSWVWVKSRVTGFANAKLQPLRCVEDVVVFYRSRPTYNPQGIRRIDAVKRNGASVGGDSLRGDTGASAGRGSLRTAGGEYVQEFTGYPRQVLSIGSESGTVHPTQKPVALMEYMIRTYTQEGETVLDNCAGSFTTGVACLNTGRNFIGIERDDHYFKIGSERMAKRAAEIEAAREPARGLFS